MTYTGSKFNNLSNILKENTSYKLNAKGLQMIEKYHSIIFELEKNIKPILVNITDNPVDIAKQSAIQIISTINSSKTGNENFDLMARLDTLTNGGKSQIQGHLFSFNSKDKILEYLESV